MNRSFAAVVSMVIFYPKIGRFFGTILTPIGILERSLEASFDVYVSGKPLVGFERADVVAGVAKLFAIESIAAEKLLDGKPHRVKSDCDKATALKYREGLTRIGAEVSFVRHGSKPHVDPPPAPEAPARFHSKDPGLGTVEWDSGDQPSESSSAEFTVAPVGTSMSEHVQRKPFKSVTVPNFDVARPGEVIPTLPEKKASVAPNIDHLQLAPMSDY